MLCLNPCSNGILSDFTPQINTSGDVYVLILVLMEYSLTSNGACDADWSSVLILVLMEYSLTDSISESIALRSASLNPCSNGILSDTLTESNLRF